MVSAVQLGWRLYAVIGGAVAGAGLVAAAIAIAWANTRQPGSSR